MTSDWGGMEAWASGWSSWMIHMSWQVALLVAVVWAISRAIPKGAASLRYALWLLVFVKLVLPPDLATPWSAGNWLKPVLPIAESTQTVGEEARDLNSSQVSAFEVPADSVPDATPGTAREEQAGGMAFWLVTGWAIVGVAGFLVMLAQYVRYSRRVTGNLAFAPGPVQQLFSVQLKALGMPNTILLRVSPSVERPGVFGAWHPMVLLPEGFESRFSEEGLAGILSHELAHIKRRDLAIGWLVALVGCLYWFHPAVWLAAFNLRREREMACDDMALDSTRQEGREYATTIVDVADSPCRALPVGAGFLGIVELSSSLTVRVRSATDALRRRRAGWATGAWLVIIALLFIPMGVWTSPAGAEAGQTGKAETETAPPKPPKVTATVPKEGAAEVDPGLKEIRVTFDQDMGAGGYSFTGGGEAFPKTSGKPYWLDRRTCVLPVALKKGRFYRVGINSSSFHGFKSAKRVPALCDVICFTTKGASKETAAKLSAPKVVALNPERGAKGVPSQTKELVVEFDQPMGAAYSWTGGGANFPELEGKPVWSEDKRTCSLKIRLKPNWYYIVGLNSEYHINFQSASGVPLSPVVWDFHTGE